MGKEHGIHRMGGAPQHLSHTPRILPTSAFRPSHAAAAAALRCSFPKATFSLQAPPFFGMGSAPRVGRHLMSSSSTESPKTTRRKSSGPGAPPIAGGCLRGRVCPRAGSGYAEGITACSRSVERSDTTGYDPQKSTTPVRGGSRIRAITRRENSRFTCVSTLVTNAPRGSAS